MDQQNSFKQEILVIEDSDSETAQLNRNRVKLKGERIDEKNFLQTCSNYEQSKILSHFIWFRRNVYNQENKLFYNEYKCTICGWADMEQSNLHFHVKRHFNYRFKGKSIERSISALKCSKNIDLSSQTLG